MCAKDRRSKDQKRKAKRTARAKRQGPAEPQPYAGEKYRADCWIPHIFWTELGTYAVDLATGQYLTNADARAAYVRLIEHVRDGEPAPLPDDDPGATFPAGEEERLIAWNIRR
jgi:hypothetical protein